MRRGRRERRDREAMEAPMASDEWLKEMRGDRAGRVGGGTGEEAAAVGVPTL